MPWVACTSAFVKPSPPSAIGAFSTRAWGRARSTPAAMWSAAPSALRLSLKPEGAISTVIVLGWAWRRARPWVGRWAVVRVVSIGMADS